MIDSKTNFSENNEKILLIVNGLSVILLVMLNCLNSLAGRGVLRDLDEGDPRFDVLPVTYFAGMIKKPLEEGDKLNGQKVTETPPNVSAL